MVSAENGMTGHQEWTLVSRGSWDVVSDANAENAELEAGVSVGDEAVESNRVSANSAALSTNPCFQVFHKINGTEAVRYCVRLLYYSSTGRPRQKRKKWRGSKELRLLFGLQQFRQTASNTPDSKPRPKL